MLLVLVLLSSGLLAAQGARVVESVIPSLAYGRTCWSTVEVGNVSDRVVTAEIEGHKETGALIALAGGFQNRIPLDPGDSIRFRLEVPEETQAAWVKVRESIPAELGPALAISANTECVAGEQLQSTPREIAYPMRNPWFAGEVSELRGSLVSLVNLSEHAARASLCYSAGGLFANPNAGASDLRPICTAALDVQIPPLAARQFPVERDGSTGFSMHTSGEALVLQLLRPVAADTRMYQVDSTIQFLGETH